MFYLCTPSVELNPNATPFILLNPGVEPFCPAQPKISYQGINMCIGNVDETFKKDLDPNIASSRSDAASSKRGHFNFIQNLGGGGGQYGDPSSFKEGHLVVQKNHTLRKIRWCKCIR